MDYQAPLFLYATALALIALLNWFAGDRSAFGRMLRLRHGAWAAMRWFGLGVFAACSMIGEGGAEHGPLVAFFGAGILLLGTANRWEAKPLDPVDTK